MKLLQILVLCCALAACGSGGSGNQDRGGSGGGPDSRSYDWAALAQTLDASLAPSGTLAGYSFVLFNGSGVLYERAGGNQDMTSTESLASATKLASVAAILTLVDQGVLDLDRPVSNYFHLGTILWPPDKSAITTRMLLNHTSGLPGFQDRNEPCLNLQTGMSLQQCAQNIANDALVYTPGSTYNYGGADYQVAGYLATVLSGRDWQQFFSQAVGHPLGLASFTYGDAARVSNPRIAGGATSNVTDYARLLAMVHGRGSIDGIEVLSSAMVAEMERNQIAGLPVAYSPLDPSKYPGYGFGLFTSDPSLHPGSPGPEFSDPGLLGTTPWVDSGTDYGAVILTNASTSNGLAVWDAVRPKIIEQLRK